MTGYFPLCADDVSSLKALGAFEEIKLHGLALVERAVPVLLDRGEMHEHILPRGALDKSITLRPVEPLHCSLLSHGKNSFHPITKNSSPECPIEAPDGRGAPSSQPDELCCVTMRGKTPQKEKTPQFSTAHKTAVRTSGARQSQRVSTAHLNVNLPIRTHHQTISPVMSTR